MIDDKYEQQQKRYWKQLRQELDRFKNELGATNSELAQCLSISRQPLVSFMQDSSRGLPIRRANIERLWDLLTDPDQHKDKHLSPTERLNREDLRCKGPDTLLRIAGFLPSSSEQTLEIDPKRYQQISSIVDRLSNLPVADFADFIKLIESIETFITNAFPSKRKTELEENQIFHLYMLSEKSNKNWLEQWIEKNAFPHHPKFNIKDKFQRAVTKLAVLGQFQLSDFEMFELYMSILEKERQSININEFLKMRVTQCQFKTLTFSLEEYISEEGENLKEEFRRASFEVERQLRAALYENQAVEDSMYLKDAVSESVMEAKVVCNFRKNNENIVWRYSSSTTHFENMLLAIARGMGYKTELELINFSISSLGKKDYSLVKVSTAFRNINNKKNNAGVQTYQGVWVDRSAVLGILQSVIVGVRSWLGENFSDSESCRSYYEVCKAVADINRSLDSGKKVLNGYGIQRAEHSGGLSANDYLEEKVIKKIKELKEGMLKQNPMLRNCFEVDLERNYCIAKLGCIHSALVEGDIIAAKKLLAEAKDSLENFNKEYISPIILYSSEEMLYKFFAGDQKFLSGKEWRSQLNSFLHHLNVYIHQESELKYKEEIKFRNFCGFLDSDMYMQASEIFGRIGRLDFCFSSSEDISYLEHSVHKFLMAAYCLSKIGDRQRTAHWIANASRACCRLGQEERARELSNIAESIIDQAIEPTYSAEYRESLMAEVNIARGERLLLIEKEPLVALEYFLRSLKGSIYIGFARLIADSLYGIARASKNLDDYRLKESFEEAYGKQDWTLNENDQGWKENKVAADIIKFVNKLYDDSQDASWSSVSNMFKEKTKSIWNGWATAIAQDDQAKHPVEDEIDGYSYLSMVR